MGESSFLTKLKTLKPDEVSTNTLKIMSKRVSEPDFDPNDVKTKSLAAGALAVWCVATQRFITVFRNVAPKRSILQAAMDSLEVRFDKSILTMYKVVTSSPRSISSSPKHRSSVIR